MIRFRLLRYAAVVAVMGGCLPSAARAQDWFLDWALDQSFSSTDPFRSPRGFTASTGGIALVGPFGAHVSFARVTDGGPDIFQDCAGLAGACVPGTLRSSYAMKTVGVGLSYDFVNPTDVMLTLGLTGTRSWHSEHLRDVATGEQFRNDLPSSLGFSASAHLRLRPMLSGIRPEFAVHYDYGARVARALDSSRNAFGVSIGLGWVVRPQRRP